jgi:hypothetical protein
MAAAQSAPAPANVVLEAVGNAQKLAYTAAPGAVLSGAVRVENSTAHAREIRLSAVEVGTAAFGGAVYGERAGKGTGRWVTLSTRSVSVGPHGARVVRFQVSVPPSASAGVHYAGITGIDAQQLRAATAAKGGRTQRIVFHRLARFALPVKVTVAGPGAAPRLDLRNAKVVVDAAGAHVLVNLENTGHTLVRTTDVDLQVKAGNRTRFSARQPLKEFVPDSTARYPITWPGVPTRGTYRLVGEIHPAGAPVVKVDAALKVDGKTVTSARRSVAGQISPPMNQGMNLIVWLSLGGATAAAAAFGLAFVRMRRRLIAATAQDSHRRATEQ